MINKINHGGDEEEIQVIILFQKRVNNTISWKRNRIIIQRSVPALFVTL